MFTQTYKDSTLQEALDLGYNTIQLKYDGWWVQHSANGVVTSSERRLEIPTFIVEPNVLLIGEYMFGTQWSQRPEYTGRTYLYDTFHSENETRIYKERYSTLRKYGPDIVKNYPIRDFASVWQELVINADGEGVVFRKSVGLVTDTILRLKKTVTKDLRAVSFEEGLGKFAGTLGTIIGETLQGVQIRVGGGLTNAVRDTVWNNQQRFMGTWFEIEGKCEFASGSIRHPQFLRWREDKS